MPIPKKCLKYTLILIILKEVTFDEILVKYILLALKLNK